MTFWTYVLHCSDDTYYCGQTDNLEVRMGQHAVGAIDGYTKHRRPVLLVWSQELPTRLEALEAERRIKGWTHAKKEALIRGDWQRVSFLTRNRQGSGRPSTSSGRAGAEDAPLPVRAEPVATRPSGRNP